MKHLLTTKALALILVVGSLGVAQASETLAETALVSLQAQEDDATKPRPALKEYDLGKKDLALEGYDPVAYFPDFQGKATEGKKSISYSYHGVLYRFSSEANKKAFVADPQRFEPMYGGWCAWAMTDGKGSKTGINPKSYTVEDGRLYVFYDGFWGDTRKTWKKKGSAPKLKANADTNWKRISKEAARPGDSESKK